MPKVPNDTKVGSRPPETETSAPLHGNLFAGAPSPRKGVISAALSDYSLWIYFLSFR